MNKDRSLSICQEVTFKVVYFVVVSCSSKLISGDCEPQTTTYETLSVCAYNPDGRDGPYCSSA